MVIRMWTTKSRTPILGAALLAALLVGCDGLEYVVHLAEGQGQIVGQVEPIDKVLADQRLNDDEQYKLELITRVRQYAVDAIGLNAGASYTQFYDTGGDPLSYNLSASRKDRLEAVTWEFPIVGRIPYLGFFDMTYLERIQADLVARGFDTYVYEVDAYSTLGIFEDPVRSPMLRRGVISLTDTIIHELLHNTIWRPNHTTFNESLATFVGRTGAMQFLRVEFGPDSEVPAFAQQRFADVDLINTFLFGLYNDLEVHYARDLSKDELIAGREAVYEAGRRRFVDEVQPTLSVPDGYSFYAELPTNNAWMLGNYRYNLNLDVFERVYELNGREWAPTLEVYRAAANASGEPFSYLRDWVAARE